MKGSRTKTDAQTSCASEFRRQVGRPLTLLAVVWAAACGGDSGTGPQLPQPQPNRPPTASGSIAAQTLTVGESVTVNAASLFTDPDGDALTYAVMSSAPGTASVALSGTTLTVTAVSAGTATITVTARDPRGAFRDCERQRHRGGAQPAADGCPAGGAGSDGPAG